MLLEALLCSAAAIATPPTEKCGTLKVLYPGIDSAGNTVTCQQVATDTAFHDGLLSLVTQLKKDLSGGKIAVRCQESYIEIPIP